MATELEQADADAKLIVEAFALGQWDKYQAAWTADVVKRIDAKFGPVPPTPPAEPAVVELGK